MNIENYIDKELLEAVFKQPTANKLRREILIDFTEYMKVTTGFGEIENEDFEINIVTIIFSAFVAGCLTPLEKGTSVNKKIIEKAYDIIYENNKEIVLQ